MLGLNIGPYMNKRSILLVKSMVVSSCNDEDAKVINHGIDFIIDDYVRFLKRMDALLQIDGINSKMMVRNDIQEQLKYLEDKHE